MKQKDKVVLLRAESVYLSRWSHALVNGDHVTQRFYAHRLDEVRECRIAGHMTEAFKRSLLVLFGIESAPPK